MYNQANIYTIVRRIKMANQTYIDPNKKSDDDQAEEQEDITFGFADLGKIILAIYSLTAPYLIAFMLLFALAIALILGYFLF